MKEKLLTAAACIRSKYGSYLATAVFQEERKLLGRINHILVQRYKILG